MGDGFQFLDIVLFAMVAAFLVLRLRSVLGKRTGHEQPRQDPMSQRLNQAENDGNVIEMPSAHEDDAPAPEHLKSPDTDDLLATGIADIRDADPAFNPAEFADGARGAFEMVVQGFAEGNTETLQMLLADDVFDNFRTAIDEREEAEETLETTIISIKGAEVIEAETDGGNALVTVKFVSEQVNVTRDSEDRIIDGDPNQVTEITDIWTFSRDTKSRDPNWKLVETRSQN